MTESWLLPVLLGIVEGLTEFLPVSSTGHLILAGSVLGFTGEFAKTFEVGIQLGAILAVVVYFRERLFGLIRGVPGNAASVSVVVAVGAAFLPAAMVGFFAHGAIKAYLFNTQTVALSLVLGGIAILWIEARRAPGGVARLEAVDLRMALWVGVAQCLSLVPGVSRAGATIMGGLLAGMDRRTASEFSFFLALPTMFAATLYDGYKNRALLVDDNIAFLALGFGSAFVTALIVIAGFMRFIQRHTFRVFAYYRILVGGLLLVV